MRRACAVAALLPLLLAGCGKKQEQPAQPPEAARVPSAEAGSPQPPGDAARPRDFAPLRSVQVKEAIYQAMKTGVTQRWQDGSLSGYAVPATKNAANGCRAVRYTVDQLPGAEPQTINACQ